MFKIGSKHDKHAPFYSNPQLDGGYFAITSTKKSLVRKNMHTPLLNKEAVRRSEYLITDMLANFLKILSRCASGTRPVDLSMGFKCLAADVSMNYTFQRPFNTLDAEGFQSELIEALDGSFTTFQWSLYFPMLFRGLFWVTMRLPRWFASRFLKSLALTKSCLEVSATCTIQPCPIDSLAHDGMNRYPASKSYTYKVALPAKGIYVRYSISTSTPTSRKDNSRLRLMR